MVQLTKRLLENPAVLGVSLVFGKEGVPAAHRRSLGWHRCQYQDRRQSLEQRHRQYQGRSRRQSPEQRRCQCQAMDIGIHIQKQAKAHKNAPQTYKDQHNTCDNVLSHCKLYIAVYAGGLLLVHSPKDIKLECSQRA
ncbi:hypothetical protein HGH94_03940 [Bacillus subtilis]|nr:hypothetical protein [Bacillus subtilis]QJC15208.1 hypothetical protein HGH94_03940 [Bacillus subtilis]UNL90626.1 hypothetical protein IE382_05275 [Bacillus subtilis]